MTIAMNPDSFPKELQTLAEKVRAGERLDAADAMICFTTPHVLHLGRLAGAVRQRMHGKTAYFNVNRHINPTNVCIYTYDCKFCSFAALQGEDHAWQMRSGSRQRNRVATRSASFTSSVACTPIFLSTGTWR